jgi:hypothetical protein
MAPKDPKVTVSTSVVPFIPKTQREKELADFWYRKGYAEAELENSPKFKKALKRKTVLRFA